MSVGLMSWVMRLGKADLSVPFWYDWDNLLNHLWVKTIVENGWYLRNESVGAPWGLDMRDFPLVDSLFLVILKLIAWATAGDVARAINLYGLLTFPLTTVTTLAALRHLGVSCGPALVAALLYTFQPFHLAALGAGHLFLASYYLIPPMVVVLLGVYLDPEAASREDGGQAHRPRSLLRKAGPGPVAICALMSCGGVYYAFFSCYLMTVAGVAGSLHRRRWGPLIRSGMLVGVIAAGVLANVSPKLMFDRVHGPNPSVGNRHPGEAEIYGLRLIDLFAPVPQHRLAVLSELRNDAERTLPSFGGGVFSIGVVGSVGFLLLLGRLVARPASGAARAWDGLAVLSLAALLLAVAGGFGTIFAYLVSPSIRAYVRINILIACFALFALALLAEQIRSRLSTPRHRRAFALGLGLVLVVGVLDQTSPAFEPPYRTVKAEYEIDADLVGRIESSLPAGSTVAQLPSADFPEQLIRPASMGHYAHLRPYLHSRTLKWSYGVMRGRVGDSWREWVDGQPPESMVETLAYAGCSGIYLDRLGYEDRGAEFESNLAGILGHGPSIVSRDGTRSFFDLREFAHRLRARCSADEWESRRYAALAPVIVRWGPGFYPEERDEGAGSSRWSWGFGELTVMNPTDRPRRVSLAMRVIPGTPGGATFRVRGPGWREALPIEDQGRVVVRGLVLPPGPSRIQFACDSPPLIEPGDERLRVFRVERFSCSPTDGAGAPSAVARAGLDDRGSLSE